MNVAFLAFGKDTQAALNGLRYAGSIFPVTAQGMALVLMMNRFLFSIASGANP